MKQPYQLTIEQVIKRFHTDPERGLTEKEVKEHRKEYGPNTLPEKKPDSLLWIFITQFRSPLIYVLLIAALLIFLFADKFIDGLIITGVLVFNAVIGTIQEGRAASVLASLTKFIKANAVVIRDGKKEIIDEKDIVVGDILVLKEGERIAADARIIQNNNLKVSEAVLTGESQPIKKTKAAIETKELPVADQKNMVFKGTLVISGSAKVVVVATGLESQLGKIHESIEQIDTEMPIKQDIKRLSYWIIVLVFCVCVFLFALGYWFGVPFDELIVVLITLFISVIPEGLPVVLTIVLVAGVYRMAQQKVLVKRMQAVEGLGRTQIIVVDKTGTLTRNEMMVSRVCVDHTLYEVTGEGYHITGAIYKNGKEVTIQEDSDLYRMAVANFLLNSAEVNFDTETKLFEVKGEPTEAALSVFSKKVGLKEEELKNEYTKLFEIPFDPKLRYHAVFYDHKGKGIVFLSGSPEQMIERAENSLSDECYQRILDEGLRVVATAQKEFDLAQMPKDEQERESFFRDIAENKIHMLGFCGIEDAIRPEVPDILKQARDAGIHIVMATGDHKKTALYVGKETGVFQPGDIALDGPEFQKMSKDEHIAKLDKITIYARVTPQDKLEIVNDMRNQGNIVAMTGDGVNDAPSLVAADLGIAMGKIGTEVAKDAADMILLDDSFVNIVNAIEQGRHIFYTLKRVILYLFATNAGEILIILMSLVLGMPLPLTPAQILWLNLVTDGFLDMGLAMEPQEAGLLKQKFWVLGNLKLLDWKLAAKMVYMAVPMAIGSIWIFSRYYHIDLNLARTITLITMALFQWFNAWNCRSMTKSVFQVRFFSNIWLLAATAFVLLLQFLLLYVPSMQFLFKTVPLSLKQWCFAILISCTIIFFEEIRKWIVRTWFAEQ